MEKDKLRYTLVNSGNLMHIALEIVKKHGIKAISGKAISDIEDVGTSFEDPTGIAGYFTGEKKITLSTIEGLSMAYVVEYYKHHASPGTEYLIGVDVEDKLDSLTERELYLSDGLLAVHKGDKIESITPFQQVMAQNIVGRNTTLGIEDEIIERANNKIARRNDYNTVSGLIISAIPSGGRIDLDKICKACDMEAFLPTFLILYKDNLDRCTVFHLDNNIKTIDDLKEQSLEIKPSLKFAK